MNIPTSHIAPKPPNGIQADLELQEYTEAHQYIRFCIQIVSVFIGTFVVFLGAVFAAFSIFLEGDGNFDNNILFNHKTWLIGTSLVGLMATAIIWYFSIRSLRYVKVAVERARCIELKYELQLTHKILSTFKMHIFPSE